MNEQPCIPRRILHQLSYTANCSFVFQHTLTASDIQIIHLLDKAESDIDLFCRLQPMLEKVMMRRQMSYGLYKMPMFFAHFLIWRINQSSVNKKFPKWSSIGL